LCDFSFEFFSHTRLKKDTQVRTAWNGSKRIYCYPLLSKSHNVSLVGTDRRSNGTVIMCLLYCSVYCSF
jgi:hypothetical protein